MKKKLLLAIVAAGITGSILVGCGNRTVFDTTYTFNKAVIKLPDGSVVEGDVQTWTDFDDGDQIQVKIGGKTYLVHSSNIVLIKQ